jgi:predicted ATP-dependent Lon-type protease
MKRMTGTVYLLEYSLRTTQHNSALEICGIQSVNQMLDQHMTRPEEQEEVAEHKI